MFRPLRDAGLVFHIGKIVIINAKLRDACSGNGEKQLS